MYLVLLVSRAFITFCDLSPIPPFTLEYKARMGCHVRRWWASLQRPRK